MTIYLHIGTSKTGTTAIQNFLFDNYTILLEHKYLYPRSLMTGSKSSKRHRDFAMTFYHGEQSTRQELVDELEAEIQKTKAENVIISAEELSGLDISSIQLLKKSLAQLSSNIKVICYLRRQDEYIQAFYAQHVKTNPSLTESIESYLHRIPNYYSLISNWAVHFGKDQILVQPYEASQMPKGVVNNFLHHVDIDDQLNPKVAHSFRTYNKGTSRIETELFRTLNKFHVDQGVKNNIIRYIKSSGDGTYQTEYNLLTSEQLQNIQSTSKAINDQIANEFLPDNKINLFEDEPKTKITASSYSKKQILDYLNHIVSRLDKKDRTKLHRVYAYLNDKKNILRVHPKSTNALGVYSQLSESRDLSLKIIDAINSYESGKSMDKICEELKISLDTLRLWIKKYKGMTSTHIMAFNELENDNERLKRMYVELAMQLDQIKESASKKDNESNTTTLGNTKSV